MMELITVLLQFADECLRDGMCWFGWLFSIAPFSFQPNNRWRSEGTWADAYASLE